MTTRIRRLNDNGIKAAIDFVEQLREDGKLPIPMHILSDSRYSEDIDINIELENRSFATRYDMGRYLVELFADVNMQPLLGDRGFWTWIALFWFDQLCPADSRGNRKPSKPYNYVLSPNYNHQPRHAIRTTWLLVDKHGEDAHFLLSKEPHERGELIEQLAARQYFISCRGIISAASQLYFDPERRTFKRGSTSRHRKGNVRRLVSYLQQLELTYDLHSVPGESIVNMLPREYEEFLPH